MPDDLIVRVEAIIRHELPPQAARAIAALIAQARWDAILDDRAREDGRLRMCVNCGKTVDAAIYKRGDELPECVGLGDMSACQFDATPEEAWQHWSTEWHKLHASLPALIAEAREAGRREGLEEAAQDVDCGCECRPMVLMALASGHPRAERDAQNVCTSKPGDCLALAAASVRALAEKEKNDAH